MGIRAENSNTDKKDIVQEDQALHAGSGLTRLLQSSSKSQAYFASVALSSLESPSRTLAGWS